MSGNGLTEQKITREQVVDMMQKMPVYEKMLSKIMHCPEKDLPEVRKKVIDAAVQMGIPFHGEQEFSYEEGNAYGGVMITARLTTEDGVRYNVAKLDPTGEIIKSTMKQCITEQQLTSMINE